MVLRKEGRHTRQHQPIHKHIQRYIQGIQQESRFYSNPSDNHIRPTPTQTTRIKRKTGFSVYYGSFSRHSTRGICEDFSVSGSVCDLGEYFNSNKAKQRVITLNKAFVEVLNNFQDLLKLALVISPNEGRVIPRLFFSTATARWLKAQHF